MSLGKMVLGGLFLGGIGAAAAAAFKSRRDRERAQKKLITPPPEPQSEGNSVEWKRRGFVGRITRGPNAADPDKWDWLVEIRPAVQGGIVQLGALEPTYELAAMLVRDWTDGVAGLTPKGPEQPASFVTYGRTGGLHTIAIARSPAPAGSPDAFKWISALTSEVTAHAANGPMLWGLLLDEGKFIAGGDATTYKEAAAAADASVKSA